MLLQRAAASLLILQSSQASILGRSIATTCVVNGSKKYNPNEVQSNPLLKKVDFRGLRLFNKRHLREHKKMLFKPFEKRDPKFKHIYEHKYGCRGTGLSHAFGWQHIPEKVPDLVVPDLTDFKLKPYVSYRTKEIYQVVIN
jgi:hypothetical protein